MPQTFERKGDAERYLRLVEATLERGEWVDPRRAAKIRLGDYVRRWIDERPGLRASTRDLYGWHLSKHIDPYIGKVPLAKVDTPLVREWRARLVKDGVSQSGAAKAYRLLRAALMTAVDEDRLLVRNPCRIRGADRETPGERPVVSAATVFVIADAMPARLRLMVLLAAFASLRFGEVTALRRRDVDLVGGTVSVQRSFSEVRGAGLVAGPPKSRAGARVIALPRSLVEVVREHLESYVEGSADALLFTTEQGRPVRRGNFNPMVGWREVVTKAGAPGLHFHDLRHTGNMLAAGSNASTRDLMARMGHDSMHAALIYQHASRQADRAIADHLDGHFIAAVRPAADDREGQKLQ